MGLPKFKRTEDYNFTITTNTSQYVEFFHPLIFLKKVISKCYLKFIVAEINENLFYIEFEAVKL